VTFRLELGERFYAGYHEWVVHPDEARVILERGYAVVDGIRFRAAQVCEHNGFPQIKIYGLPDDPSDPQCRGLHEGLMRMRMDLDHGMLKEAA
jgi:hypothetical protein